MRNVCVGRYLLCMLVRASLTDMVTLDQSPERSERISHVLCSGMLFQAEGQPSTKSWG